MVNRIGIIIPFFGKCPGYINHFITGCGYNTSIDWFLMTDIEEFLEAFENIHTQNKLGLIGIRQRIRLIDGTLQIRSNPGQGTFLSIKIPL